MQDFHFHTNLSFDGKSTLLEYCQRAAGLGVTVLCSTDHYDLLYRGAPVPRVPDPDDAVAALREARAAYPGLDIRLGMEVSYRPDSHQAAALLLSRFPLDFIINSTHEVGDTDPYFPPYFEGKTRDEAYRLYLEQVFLSLDAAYEFNVLGHLGYVFRNAPYMAPVLRHREFPELLDNILMRLIYLGKGLELNTSTLRAHQEPMPAMDIFSRYRYLGGEIVTIGSDAHSAARLCDGFSRAKELLSGAGFRHYALFKNRQPEFIKLE